MVILEYNDQRPYFLPYQNLTIAEEQPVGSFVIALLARDEDDPIDEYNLIDNPFNFFAIGYKTGKWIIFMPIIWNDCTYVLFSLATAL